MNAHERAVMERPTAPLRRVMTGTSAEMVASLLAVLLPDAQTVLDMTHGSGKFWTGADAVRVTGIDLDPTRARDVVADFTRLPFGARPLDVCIFDPPYITEAGAGSLIGQRFGSYPTIPELRVAVMAGAAEAWRVSRLGVIVKVMDYCHASRLVRMSRWVEEAIPADLYDVAYLTSRGKVEDEKWSRRGAQLSVRSNATTWMVWRRDGVVHKRRPV
jgi:hypothetical protein